jgi:hypothetical protein
VQQRVPALTRGHKCLFAAGLTCAGVHQGLPTDCA